MSKDPWELLADSGIKGYLANPSQKLDEEFIRMLFLELFQRVKVLETENYTLKTLLFLQNYLNEDTYKETRTAIHEFLQKNDQEKANEADFWANSGIPFVDWVNFVTKGTFESSH